MNISLICPAAEASPPFRQNQQLFPHARRASAASVGKELGLCTTL